MKTFLFLALYLVFSCQETNASPNSSSTTNQPYVILISLDGFRYDYIDRAKTPHIDELIRNGVQAEGLIPTFPSKTFPNHYSIVTGMHAGTHGLVDNSFKDQRYIQETYSPRNTKAVQDKKWYEGEAIWTTAKKNGLKTGSVFWVGSEAVGKTPDYYLPFDDKLDNKRRIDILLEWLQKDEKERPQLLTLYYSDIDHAGHTYGPNSSEVISTVEDIDRIIGYLNAKLKTLPFYENIHLVLVSDHGMSQLSNERRISFSKLKEKVNEAELTAYSTGTMLKIFSDDDSKLEKAYNSLASVATDFKLFTREELKTQLHYGHPYRCPDLVAVPNDGYLITDNAVSGGTHGFLPTDKSMQGIFIASGKQFIQGKKIDAFENVHIYPILTKLLNLTYTHKIDGTHSISDKIFKK